MTTCHESLGVETGTDEELLELLDAAHRLPGVKELMEAYEAVERIEEQMESYARLVDARAAISPSDSSGPMIWQI